MTGFDSSPPAAPWPLSPQSWVDELCRELLAASSSPLVESLSASRPRCLFLAGSAALGEAIGWAPEPADAARSGAAGILRLLLSDLDLGVITELPVPSAVRRRAGELLEGLAGPVLARHAATYRAPDGGRCPLGLGIYEVRALQSQRPTPGLVDTAHRGRVLWGDPDGPSRFAVPPVTAIPDYEAWRLVGNRAVERLAAECLPVDEVGPAGAAHRSAVALHSRAKLAAGLWTARLVLRGEYAVGWPARASRLQEAMLAQPDDVVVCCADSFRSFLRGAGGAGLPSDEVQRRLLTDALGAWLVEASAAAGPKGRDRFPEVGFLAERLSLRERFRLWKREPRHPDGVVRGAGRGRSLWQVADPFSGTPQGRRFAAAVLFWRLFGGHSGTGTGSSSAPVASAEATALWNEGSRRFLGAPCEAGPELPARLLRALGIGPAPGAGSVGPPARPDGRRNRG